MNVRVPEVNVGFTIFSMDLDPPARPRWSGAKNRPMPAFPAKQPGEPTHFALVDFDAMKVLQTQSVAAGMPRPPAWTTSTSTWPSRPEMCCIASIARNVAKRSAGVPQRPADSNGDPARP